MLKQLLRILRPLQHPQLIARRLESNFIDDRDLSKDQDLLREELSLTGVYLDDIDKVVSEDSFHLLSNYYPKLNVDPNRVGKPFEGHNLVVIQPWVSYANFGEFTEPEIQLEECVSLGNTIHNWNVIGKKIVFARSINRKELVGPKAFEELKELIFSYSGVSAVLFGVDLLSGIQLATLERNFKMPVYDRFTTVLNIFRQHARSREAKIQVALAELPYIRSHLREIHESSEYSSAAESLKLLVGGIGEKFYHQRMSILKRREVKLKQLLEECKKQRETGKRNRLKSNMPTVSVVGYTNSGKTSLIKYLSEDKDMEPKDQLFATLDVTAHTGQLPSSKDVIYLDTVGFLSRIPLLLIEAFSATLKDVQESDLILHILDVTHPDHKLQYMTVIKALETLKISKNLLDSRLTIGNKCDLLKTDAPPENLPSCDLLISVTKHTNLNNLVNKIDKQLMKNLNHQTKLLRVENGGSKYSWLRKNAKILDCKADETDANYLICRVIMSPVALGRWSKNYGAQDIS